MNVEAEIAVDDASGVAISERGRIVRSVIYGQPIYFTITNPRDAIQQKHRTGQFYEPEELQIIRQHFDPGSVFCDIGANIGNHSMYVLKFLHASRAVLFEPNPAAIAILRSNLNMNGLVERCDLSHLGFGLSDATADGLGMVVPRLNLGGGKLVEGAGGMQVRRGDEMLADTSVDFLKIDVEGMELRVLEGMSGVISARRPSIFIEIDDVNAVAFGEWVTANGYEVRTRFKRYRTNSNFMIVPKQVRRRRNRI